MGKRHGTGTLIFTNGDSLKAVWINDKIQRDAKVYYTWVAPSKRTLECEIVDGKFNGEGEMTGQSDRGENVKYKG